MVKTLATAVAERIKIANNAIEDSISNTAGHKGLKFWLLVTVPAVVAISGIAGGTYLVIRRRSQR
ncbi:MAG TPA: hypothetical protein VFQ30_18265 [Ktedonobacteraceae bacterium]|nr:hypothetical protein [Ktedonobacteraceae bacterium]